jgi:hypothetical protein
VPGVVKLSVWHEGAVRHRLRSIACPSPALSLTATTALPHCATAGRRRQIASPLGFRGARGGVNVSGKVKVASQLSFATYGPKTEYTATAGSEVSQQ